MTPAAGTPPAADLFRLDLSGAVAAVMPAVLRLRRELHVWPEVGLSLPRTQRAVLGALPGDGLTISTGRGSSSVVAVLETGRAGPHLMLRADMDALPIAQDPSAVPRSRVPGVMHACGHDAHTAMLVGAATVLAAARDTLRGRVTFVFQPGEEGHGGAALMVEEGLLDPLPDSAFALHTSPTYPAGTLATRVGPMFAAADWFTVRVVGDAGHAALQRPGNPVTAAAELCLALERLPLTSGPFEAAVVTVAGLQAGDTHTAIPATATLRGTVRSFSPAAGRRLRDELVRVTTAVAALRGVGAEVTWELSYPVTSNDAACTQTLRRVARDVLGADAVRDIEHPLTVSEDFGEIGARVPAVMALIGTGDPGAGPAAPNHSPGLRVHEPALEGGVALLVRYAQAVVGAPA
ncbi:amidohydrolase [Cellulomonas sp. Sa3CUA2]|uniref:Amidohydrolase n=1 Tax=Cellulomonas avistercoris TaxID=2762242 RepID=A0ABR8Q9Z3_9CELL|nr:M20 family metallopeptidase [Cellulomonas avistercoris]MBD7917064.1 amidohydrolase [Cellulomonas avistercoris]